MNPSRTAVLLVSVLIVGAAHAQSDTPWAGVHAGLNAGSARHDTCNSWTAHGAALDPAGVAGVDDRRCAGGGTLVGMQIGYNFQYRRFMWGLGAEYDVWSAESRNHSVKYSGEALPPGTYEFAGNLSPKGFGLIAPRIGYAGFQWQPYLEAGALVTTGSRDSTLGYVVPAATKSAASFNGGKSFATAGWVAGGGFEYGLNGPWSLTMEYLHATLNSGAGRAATCDGSASACAAFSGVSFDSSHTGFTANLFRIGINYWFGYWEP